MFDNNVIEHKFNSFLLKNAFLMKKSTEIKSCGLPVSCKMLLMTKNNVTFVGLIH